MHWPFQIHRVYNRRADIHAPFGGQEQGGIVTPAKVPGIFIFTGHGAAHGGYQDAFGPDGSLRYTGQGLLGDMKMNRGNAAIRDHAQAGKDLLVFSQMIKGGGVRFEGLFVYDGYTEETQSDSTGTARTAFVFRLLPLTELDRDDAEIANEAAPTADIQSLRKLAYSSAGVPPQGQVSTRTVYQRSRDVRDYVLARANGICEGCSLPAPFVTVKGRPFLEAHHIRRLSDGGPDDPRHMVGICPNCHRRAHHGADAATFNGTLASVALATERGL